MVDGVSNRSGKVFGFVIIFTVIVGIAWVIFKLDILWNVTFLGIIASLIVFLYIMTQVEVYSRERAKQITLEKEKQAVAEAAQREAQRRLEIQKYEEENRKERLEKARNLETSGRYDEAAKWYDELEMYEKAGECRRMAKTTFQVSTSFNLGKDGTVSVKCPTCGSSQVLQSKSNLVTCEHCGNSYAIAKKVLDML
jgi:ribosomal protein S27E